MKTFDYENVVYLKKLRKLAFIFYSKYIYRITTLLQIKRAKFLDVGCGDGRVLSALQSLGFSKCYGVDVSRTFIHAAKKRGLKHIHYYNGKEIPFQRNTFDVVGAFNVLEHVPNPVFFLREAIKYISNKK